MTAMEALESLGETADEVSAFLEDKGITGVIGDAESCPLACYLRSQGFKHSVVDDHQFLASKRQGIRAWKDLPPGAKHFVQLFDSGYYPKLIKEGS